MFAEGRKKISLFKFLFLKQSTTYDNDEDFKNNSIYVR
jgi:hypothetical protein